jgi:hypothetical protein
VGDPSIFSLPDELPASLWAHAFDSPFDLDFRNMTSSSDRYCWTGPLFPRNFHQELLRPMTLEQQEEAASRAHQAAPRTRPVPFSVQRQQAEDAFEGWWAQFAAGCSDTPPELCDEVVHRVAYRVAQKAWGEAIAATHHAAIDRSDAADAARMRWMLSGNGYFMEEASLCGCAPCSQWEQDDARLEIDDAMTRDG